MDTVTTDIASAPLPTAQTLRRRQSLFFQAWRFLALNRRFVSMIMKGEH